jgi:hypothetical protein
MPTAGRLHALYVLMTMVIAGLRRPNFKSDVPRASRTPIYSGKFILRKNAL